MQLNGFTKNKNKALTVRMAYRKIAWCYSLSQKLRGQNPSDTIDECISQEELESIKNHHNIPLALLDKQNQDLSMLHKEKIVNDYQQIQIDNTLVNLCASMGKAERIKNTDFPKT
jgi:putative membrane protein